MSGERSLQDLLRLARSGDRGAFDLLAREHEGALRAFLVVQLGAGLRGRVEVDDLLQDTLLRAFTSLEQFRGGSGGELQSWLLAIGQHAAVDRARRLTAQKQDYRREVALPRAGGSEAPGAREAAIPPGDPSSPQTSPSRILQREERLERLLAAVDQLAPDHREVIRLSLIEQLPAAEVARRLERSPKAVSMLLLRAMRALKEVFGDTSSLALPRPNRPDSSDDARELR